MQGKLLLVDDDRFILNPLSRLLGLEGFHCTLAVSGEEAARLLAAEVFDLILLDIGLPDIDGVSFCRRIRAKLNLPIIMLTARDTSHDKILGLEVGADDYITKPFDPKEVIARVRAQLRRSQEYTEGKEADKRLHFGPLMIDPELRDAVINGKNAGLTTREFELIYLMARHRDKALARDWLFEQVWGYDAELGLKTLAVTIRRLRCKVEADPDNPCCLRTIRGFGYRLTDPNSSPDDCPATITESPRS